MKVVGIIAEYNPFHNGHKYHMQEVKKLTDSDYVIVVMSPDFTQRGTPALLSKYDRTRMALENGADLVLELPLYYATGSAEYFAAGSVSLLDKLGVVTALGFGSECGDIQALTDAATLLYEEPPLFKSFMKEALKKGMTFPQARNYAIVKLNSQEDLFEVLKTPNNILGIEYMKTLLKRKSSITPYTLKRNGSGYHDTGLTTPLSSALAIRTALFSEKNISTIYDQVPEAVFQILQDRYLKSAPIFTNDLSGLLNYKLQLEYLSGYEQYLDITQDFSDKIQNNIHEFTTFDSFCNLLKTKDITYSRISRSLLHIILNITKDNMNEYVAQDYISYARMLGFRKSSTELLSNIKRQSEIPLLSKLANAKDFLQPKQLSMLTQDIQATHIYNTLVTQKYGINLKNEYIQNIIIVS